MERRDFYAQNFMDAFFDFQIEVEFFLLPFFKFYHEIDGMGFFYVIGTKDFLKIKNAQTPNVNGKSRLGGIHTHESA